MKVSIRSKLFSVTLMCCALGSQAAVAQAPMKYRFTSKSTNFMDMVTFNRGIDRIKAAGVDATAAIATKGDITTTTTSLITVTSRDSIGGKVWTILVDSSKSELSPYTAATRLASPAPPPPPGVTPGTAPAMATAPYDVFIKDGVLVSASRGGRLVGGLVDAKHPWMNLLSALPGTTFLIPVAELPAAIGGIKQDTVYSKQAMAGPVGFAVSTDGSRSPLNLPASTVYDSLVVVFHRASTDTVHVALNKRSTRIPEGGSPSAATSSTIYALNFDNDKRVRQVNGTVETVTTRESPNPNTPILPSRSKIEYTIVRMP